MRDDTHTHVQKNLKHRHLEFFCDIYPVIRRPSAWRQAESRRSATRNAAFGNFCSLRAKRDCCGKHLREGDRWKDGGGSQSERAGGEQTVTEGRGLVCR